MGRCEELRAVLMVLDPARAEADLATAQICCPSCSAGRLRPWGFARTRVLRYLGGVRRTVRPRRARCRSCATTHVLLPAEVLPRHADTVEVVLSALLASHAGKGHRPIATDLDVPVDTVRSWLRRVTGRAESLRVAAIQWAHRCDPELPVIGPTGSALGDALTALGMAAAATRSRLARTATPWQLIGMVTAGLLVMPLLPARAD